MDIQGKRIVLTGAASGVGKATLTRLASYNAQVVAVDRNGEALEKVLAEQSGPARLHSFQCDLSVSTSVDELFDFAISEMGGIDIFIANAGFTFIEKLEHADWEHMEAIYRTNVFSPIYAVEKMRELDRGSEYMVVITSSYLGRLALEGYALYCSTKAALDRFAEGYRLEKPKNAKLMLVYPLAVRSEFYKSAGNAPVPFPSQSPKSVARAIVEGIEKDRKEAYASILLPIIRASLYVMPFAKRSWWMLESFRFRRWLAKK